MNIDVEKENVSEIEVGERERERESVITENGDWERVCVSERVRGQKERMKILKVTVVFRE